jgi:hypothetical protein
MSEDEPRDTRPWTDNHTFAPRLVIDTHGQTERCGLAGSGTARLTIELTTTTMASSLARIHLPHWIPRTATNLSYSCRRRAMMSAWSSRSATATQPVPSSPKPPLHDTPPIVIPTSNAPLSPDAASPQTAARPPSAPKVTRPKPTLRAQKAALTLVSPLPPHPFLPVSDYSFFLV